MGYIFIALLCGIVIGGKVSSFSCFGLKCWGGIHELPRLKPKSIYVSPTNNTTFQNASKPDRSTVSPYKAQCKDIIDILPLETVRLAQQFLMRQCQQRYKELYDQHEHHQEAIWYRP
eukprot:275942_1